MKLIYLMMSILCHFAVFGQVDSLGLDDNPKLSEAEANYLDEKFETERGRFTFYNKKVAFITGSTGSRQITKQNYFFDEKGWARNNDHVVSTLSILTKEENESTGYDAIVTIWVKVLTNKSRRKIIRELEDTR